MLTIPEISLKQLLNSRTGSDRSYRTLFLVNLFTVAGVLLVAILDTFHSFQTNFYPLEISLLGISIPTLYFLSKGATKTAVNLTNLLPVPIYFLLVSPGLAIFPPQQSYFLHVFILTTGICFLFIYAESYTQLLVFLIISTLSLINHFYLTGSISKIFFLFWTSREILLNPLFLFLLIAVISSYLFQLSNTKIKVLKETIVEKESATYNLFNKSPLGLIQITVQRDEMGEKSGLKIDYINPVFEQLFNLKNDEIKGENVVDLFQLLFKSEVNWQEIFLNRTKTRHEILLPQSGRWFKILVVHTEKDEIISFLEEITAIKNNLIELENSRHRYKLLIETIPDIFFIIDKEGTYIDYVAKEEESFKFSAEEIIGSTIFEVGYSAKMVRQVFSSIQKVINHDVIETIEYVLEVIGKGSCFFEMRMVKLTDNSVMAISRDITKQKMAQQKIEEARRKAEEADQLKSAFLQNISHEVRTPLNAIVGFSNVLLTDDEISESDQKSYLQLIIRNGHILLHVFNNTIKLSRLQSGLITVEKKFTYINSMLHELHRHFLIEKEQLGKDHLKIMLTCGNANEKFSILLDAQKIRDILESLIDNAIKFTRIGEINFGYRFLEGNYIEFFVSDTGIGIPEEKFDEIFKRFHQLDSGMTREYGGTGIGLSLAKDFADLMDTKIKVQSVSGKGSRFSFIIPVEAEKGHLKIV
jgi:PAS domain S-box-containing protein